MENSTIPPSILSCNPTKFDSIRDCKSYNMILGKCTAGHEFNFRYKLHFSHLISQSSKRQWYGVQTAKPNKYVKIEFLPRSFAHNKGNSYSSRKSIARYKSGQDCCSMAQVTTEDYWRFWFRLIFIYPQRHNHFLISDTQKQNTLEGNMKD